MSYIKASWPVPANIKAFTTTRLHGMSLPPFTSNNLALHVDDNPMHVRANRLNLAASLELPSAPEWLEQTHSTRCILVEEDKSRLADAAITREPLRVLSILTADCLPILLCNKAGSEIAAIHSGWKGMAAGIIENTLAKMQSSPADLFAWCGPAICHHCYEVGEEVYEKYMQRYPFVSQAFKRQGTKFLADLSKIAELILLKMPVGNVYQSNLCTFEQNSVFYSYRREQKTGRIASLIWFHED